MDTRTVLRAGAHVLAVTGVVRSVREARAEDDKLKMFDGFVHAVAIATALALLLREVKREQQDHNSGLDRLKD